MKTNVLVITLLLLCAIVNAQSHDSTFTRSKFQSNVSKLNSEVISLRKSNFDLKRDAAIRNRQIEKLISQLTIAQSTIRRIADSLHTTVKTVSASNIKTQAQLKSINQIISIRTIYQVIGVLVVTLLILTVFLILHYKHSISIENLDIQIIKTNQNLQNESLKVDSKLIEILQSQLVIINKEREGEEAPLATDNHSLPLRVGEEIHRMRKRIEAMPKDVKGLSALTNSLQRLEEEFNNNGYIIEDLSGKKYVDGMKVEARFIDNPDIPTGEEIITDVLRPQILYKNIVVQFAKVEVSKSY